MISLYYRIWVDAIIKIRENPLRKEDWKWMVQVYMAMIMAIKFMFLMAILQRNIIQIYFYRLDLHFFKLGKFNLMFDFFILYFIPIFIMNYYLIFYKNKYELIIKKYKYEKGKLFVKYFLLSLFIPLLLLIGAFLFR